MTKFALTLLAAHAFSTPTCGGATGADLLGSSGPSWTAIVDSNSNSTSAANDSPGADCPTPDPGQNAPDLWLSSFEDDPSTNASSVAVDARNDVYLTTQGAGTRKVGSDGAVIWSAVLDEVMKEDADSMVFIQDTAKTLVERLAKDKVIP